jgi:hypothetical protein
MNKQTTFFRLAIIALWIVLGSASTAFGYGSGITGQTQSGCTCHGGSNNATTVSVQGLSGNTLTMSPSENRSFTIIVAHSTQPKAGVNISIKNSGGTNVGTLSAGTGLQLSGGELTHTVTKRDISSGQATFTFTWTAPTATGTYSLRAAGNAVNDKGNDTGDEWNFMNTITITVATPSVTVNAPNGGETLCRGSQTNITWTPSLINGNVKIELTSDGTNFTQIASVAATPSTYAWTIPAAQTIGNTYKIKISDASNATINDLSDANFSILSAPVITTQPKPDTVCPGSPVTLSVTTDNPTGYTYQWRKNGNAITGATATTYSIASAQALDGASYDVTVTGCSALTSNAVTLIINSAPSITSQPNDTNVCPGGSATLKATAVGTNLTYQWKRNNTNITGATNPTLAISTVTQADTGSYVLVVSGKCNPPQSTSPITLRFTSPSTITKQPRDTTVCFGETIQFSVEAAGNGLSYQWQKDGKVIDGAQGSNLVIPNVTSANLGSYSAIVKNSCNLLSTSTSAVLNAREPVAITTQPKDTSVQTNLTATFTVAATGTNVKYQWMKNGTNRPADTLSTLTISNIKLSDSGIYKCVAKNICGSVESAVAKLTVTAPPAGAALALNIASVDFGCTKAKTTKDSILSNVVFNGGGQPLNVTGVALTGADAAEFSIISGGSTFTLAPGEKHTIALRFTPLTKEAKTAALEFTSNSSTTAPKLSLIGKGCGGTISTFTASVGISEVGKEKDTSIKICNTGDFNIVVSNVSLAGANTSDFTLGTLPTFPTIVKPGDCLTITTKFTPTTSGKRVAEILVKTDEGDFTFPLEGTATPSTSVDELDSFIGGVSAYPNPASGNVVFAGIAAAPMPVKVRIFDALGNTRYQTTISIVSAGSFNFTWDGTTDGIPVPSGNYITLVSIGAQTIRVPFVIVR